VIHGNDTDVYWLAGLLEGEGAFDAHRGKYPRIRLAMTDRDVVGRAASLMDTSVRCSLHPAPAKATWHSEVSGERAAAIMRELLPHMGSRRSQRIADVLGVLAFRGNATPPSSVAGPAVTRPAGIAKPATAA
jgi:hypothetical protein